MQQNNEGNKHETDQYIAHENYNLFYVLKIGRCLYFIGNPLCLLPQWEDFTHAIHEIKIAHGFNITLVKHGKE